MYAPFIQRVEKEIPMGVSAEHHTGEVLVLVNPQEAPSPPRRGETPARAAKEVINFYFHPLAAYPSFDLLNAGKVLFARRAALVRGHMLPHEERANVYRGAPGSYGEQFEIGGPDEYDYLA